jgi:hypothetical protein
MSRSPHAFLFLSLHLWASKQHDHGDYFLSRPYAAEFGIPESAYQRCVERFHPEVLRIVRRGTRHPSGGEATVFRLIDPPLDTILGEYLVSPAEFARLCIQCQYMVL